MAYRFANGYGNCGFFVERYYGRVAGQHSVGGPSDNDFGQYYRVMVYYGMGAALAVRVSHFMGQKDFSNLRRAVNSGMGIILSLAIVASLFFYLARTPIIYSFTEDHEVMVVVSSLIFSLIVYQFGDALQITFANALRGTTDVKPMMWIAFFSYFIVALPVGYLCGFTWGGGVVGVWVAFPAGLFTVATVDEKIE